MTSCWNEIAQSCFYLRSKFCSFWFLLLHPHQVVGLRKKKIETEDGCAMRINEGAQVTAAADKTRVACARQEAVCVCP